MANPSLPSFVELMASLGLQDEHTANALLRGAAADSGTPLSAVPATTPDHATYRQSNASIDTPLVTPLSSPPVQRERPASHGKKRYSPYGLGDIYTRRGSVPDMAHHGQDRRLHHLSAPEPYLDHSSNSGRATDEDGDEEMEDASVRHQPTPPPQPPRNYKTPNATLHCAGQPNLLISRQRIPRSGHTQAGGNMPRTKSHSHMRTTSIGASQQRQQQQQQQQTRPPMPSPRTGIDMPMDTERSNVNDEGDIAVVSISSLLRRSHPISRPVAAAGGAPAAAPAAAATTTTGQTPTVSLDSPRGFQFPTAASSGSTSSLSESLRPPQQQQQQPHRIPPSAPPTKTSFGFLPGTSLGGNISSTSISAVRRARHARSSSARSVREMIRERESNVLLAPLHSFHPMGETEEERDTNSLKPSESRIRHRSSGRESVHSTSTTTTTTTDDRERGATTTPPIQISSHSSFLPLDDSSRSFSHRRRVKRHTADAATTTTTTTRTGGKRSSPPPPLMLPTLPISFNIRALVGGEREGGGGGNGGDKDRLAATDAGYVSRRDPHSPDPRGSWRRRVAPLEVAGGV